MPVNVEPEETSLLEAAIAGLRGMLPPDWQVERSSQPTSTGSPALAEALPVPAIDLRAPNGVSNRLAVETKQVFDPRTAEDLLTGVHRMIRMIARDVPVLVVAPWMNARTQELLASGGVNYIDLTGNALIRLANPATYIKSVGATRNPRPAVRGAVRAQGPKAGRLIRLLADVRPPYGVGELAKATALSVGYVSRLLDVFDLEALVQRSRRGSIVDVDVAGLIRRWAESYDVFKANQAASFIAPVGAREALSILEDGSNSAPIAITGSFAAVRLAPVAAPALLMAYCDDVASLADKLGLLPASEGANVVLLRPFDPVVWDRTRQEDGPSYVAPSQAAADCLTGSGRMPAEGEALLDWMIANPSSWRVASIDDVVSGQQAA
jgi:hypothetical protein